MSIICNTRCLNSFLTGSQRYTQKVLDNMPEDLIEVSPDPEFSRGMKGHLWEQLILPARVGKNLLWSPSNSGPLFCRRQVVTVHDLVSIDHPEWFNKTYVQWYNYMLPRVCKNADHIITISDFTRQRILEWFKVPESKISLVYNGGERPSAIQSVKTLDIPFKRYVLSLGSLEIRKNFTLILRSWKAILGQLPDDVGLMIVGGKVNQKIFNDAGIGEIPERVYFTGHVPDEYIAQLYANAMLFVYLSTYEGFGLPPLEAMNYGTPVLASNTTAIPEVVGDAGMLIDPYSAADCENALLKLINNDSLRLEMAGRSLTQAQKFDWRNTANQTFDILKRFS